MFKNFTFRIPFDTFKDTQFLTGLRAYAALAVFFIHSGGAGLRQLGVAKNMLNKLVDFGKYGVVVFFVLSAYTIAMSLDHSEQIDLKKYLVRRLFRVVPMYYFIILLAYFTFGGIQSYFDQFGVSNSWQNLGSHLTFANLFQIEYRNNLIGVEWSVPIEIFYYLVIPFLFIGFSKIRQFGIHIFIISLSIVFLGPIFFNFDYSKFRFISYHWSLLKYLFCFVFGLVLYQFQKNYKDQIPRLRGIIFLELMILLFCFICTDLLHAEEFTALWTGAVILVIASRSKTTRFFFENKFILFIGTISYSFYLLHFPVVMYLTTLELHPTAVFLLGLIITCILSYLSYKFIEEPFVKLGKTLSSSKG